MTIPRQEDSVIGTLGSGLGSVPIILKIDSYRKACEVKRVGRMWSSGVWDRGIAQSVRPSVCSLHSSMSGFIACSVNTSLDNTVGYRCRSPFASPVSAECIEDTALTRTYRRKWSRFGFGCCINPKRSFSCTCESVTD
jgi:hypothetical protein